MARACDGGGAGSGDGSGPKMSANGRDEWRKVVSRFSRRYVLPSIKWGGCGVPGCVLCAVCCAAVVGGW